MPEFPDTNHSLIGRVQELGDEASGAEFLRIYQPVVLRMARKRGLQDADAMDAMQQIFISVSRAVAQIRARRASFEVAQIRARRASE